MENLNADAGRILGELFRLQQWAGTEKEVAARAFGLVNGFETALREEHNGYITEETQDLVEDMLEDVEAGKQGTDGLSIKDRLHGAGVDETVASKVMQLCLLQSRFLDGVEAVIKGRGSVFSHLERKMSEPPWNGAMFYAELVDTSEEAPKTLHAVLTPCIPRIGEVVTPQAGSAMKVVDVEYVTVTRENRGGVPYLIPHVYLVEAENEKSP